MKLGLIGFPLSHSQSKIFFEKKFSQEKLSGFTYELFAIPEISQFPMLLKTEKPVGLNVTIPYKESVLPFCTHWSDTVKMIGATNCLKIMDGEILAFNTDVIGFEKSILRLLQPHHNRALILGNGGSSKAVQWVFKKLGIPFSVVSRNTTADYTYASLTQRQVTSYRIIVNTTPLGMFPNTHEYPDIPYSGITDKHLAVDVIYNPPLSSFLQKAAAHGATIMNGLEMFRIQAEASWKIWTQ
jgi:shikimate dehydrogenase